MIGEGVIILIYINEGVGETPVHIASVGLPEQEAASPGGGDAHTDRQIQKHTRRE